MLMERMRQEQPLDSITGDVITALQNLRAVPKKHHRILCLDGGGMKGLIQIEVLMQIEKSTGKKITELFDWIVGTSTGGIVALGLVYGEECGVGSIGSVCHAHAQHMSHSHPWHMSHSDPRGGCGGVALFWLSFFSFYLQQNCPYLSCASCTLNCVMRCSQLVGLVQTLQRWTCCLRERLKRRGCVMSWSPGMLHPL